MKSETLKNDSSQQYHRPPSPDIFETQLVFRKCGRLTFVGVGSHVCAHPLGGMRQTASLLSPASTGFIANDSLTHGPEVPAGKGQAS